MMHKALMGRGLIPKAVNNPLQFTKKKAQESSKPIQAGVVAKPSKQELLGAFNDLVADIKDQYDVEEWELNPNVALLRKFIEENA